MTIREIAKVTGISAQTVQRYVDEFGEHFDSFTDEQGRTHYSYESAMLMMRLRTKPPALRWILIANHERDKMLRSRQK